MKYKFDQFDAQIENPTIEIDTKSIRLNAVEMKISVDVALIVDGAKMVVYLDKIPFTFPFNVSDLESAVGARLVDFEVSEFSVNS